MADRHLEPDSPELRARWGNFAWTAENAVKAPSVTLAHEELSAESWTVTVHYVPVSENDCR